MEPKKRIPSSPTKKEKQEIHLVKEGHHYLFKYQETNQLSVVCAMLGAAMDPRLNLDLDDAREMLSAMGINVAPA